MSPPMDHSRRLDYDRITRVISPYGRPKKASPSFTPFKYNFVARSCPCYQTCLLVFA